MLGHRVSEAVMEHRVLKAWNSVWELKIFIACQFMATAGLLGTWESVSSMWAPMTIMCIFIYAIFI